ncbi:MAG: fused MFS/spermidine synthase [Deltaproteobacteria bacterium]|nr:fused MFS/spermidine synthase [Deltaproteobacteria bacterium]
MLKNLTKSFSSNGSKVIYEGDSAFHHITITEKDGVRTLHLGPEARESQTSISLAKPETPIFEYPGMVFLGLALTQKNKNILMLGLGGGFIPNLFKKYLKDHNLTIVELDPLIVELAGTYFGFEAGENVKVILGDGLEFVAAAQEASYDQIWLDAFNGHYIPPHMCNSDFLAMVKLKLVEEGLCVQNLHQTAWLYYQTQIEDTARIFSQTPLLLSGTRSANTICMSLNSEFLDWPPDTQQIIARVKTFQTKVGPYILTEEAQKTMKRQTARIKTVVGR